MCSKNIVVQVINHRYIATDPGTASMVYFHKNLQKKKNFQFPLSWVHAYMTLKSYSQIELSISIILSRPIHDLQDLINEQIEQIDLCNKLLASSIKMNFLASDTTESSSTNNACIISKVPTYTAKVSPCSWTRRANCSSQIRRYMAC